MRGGETCTACVRMAWVRSGACGGAYTRWGQSGHLLRAHRGKGYPVTCRQRYVVRVRRSVCCVWYALVDKSWFARVTQRRQSSPNVPLLIT